MVSVGVLDSWGRDVSADGNEESMCHSKIFILVITLEML